MFEVIRFVLYGLVGAGMSIGGIKVFHSTHETVGFFMVLVCLIFVDALSFVVGRYHHND